MYIYCNESTLRWKNRWKLCECMPLNLGHKKLGSFQKTMNLGRTSAWQDSRIREVKVTTLWCVVLMLGIWSEANLEDASPHRGGPGFIVCVDLDGCVFRYDATMCLWGTWRGVETELDFRLVAVASRKSLRIGVIWQPTVFCHVLSDLSVRATKEWIHGRRSSEIQKFDAFNHQCKTVEFF